MSNIKLCNRFEFEGKIQSVKIIRDRQTGEVRQIQIMSETNRKHSQGYQIYDELIINSKVTGVDPKIEEIVFMDELGQDEIHEFLKYRD